jgi:beta-N-acetylhexosaminidase
VALSELDACLLARFPGTRPPDWLRRWLDDGLGGVLLFAENITGPAQLRGLTADLRAHNPEVLIAADEEGGIVTRVEARTGSSYPGNGALGAVGDTGLTRQVAASIGAMLASGGVNLDLAPTADVASNPANPVIGVRSFGADPGRVAAHTAAFVAGIQSNLVAACAKHFPGHGRADADSHVELPVVAASLHELSETDLAPFRAAIEAGVRSVMTAHVVFPAIDKVPATISRRLVAGLLRGELGFGGVIITDALGMAAIGDGAARADGAVRSLAAGADLLCLPAGRAAQQRARDTLAAAVRSGPLSSARLAESAARVRELAAWARARPASPPDPSVGAEAARRALLVDTATVPLPGPPYVLDAGGRMSSLLGDHASSLLGLLRARDPAVAGVRLTEPRDNPGGPGGEIGPAGPDRPVGPDGPVGPAGLEALIARGAGRPLVLAVRDAHRRAWQRELVGRVLARRPDAVVVGTGTVHDQNLASGSYLGTRGAGRANLAAAADVLLGRSGPDGTRSPDGPPGRASPGEPAW